VQGKGKKVRNFHLAEKGKKKKRGALRSNSPKSRQCLFGEGKHVQTPNRARKGRKKKGTLSCKRPLRRRPKEERLTQTPYPFPRRKEKEKGGHSLLLQKKKACQRSRRMRLNKPVGGVGKPCPVAKGREGKKGRLLSLRYKEGASHQPGGR